MPESTIPDKAITPPDECTGCGLCANVCAHNAITMVWNVHGFLIPQVNTMNCINCGACVIACPAQPEHLVMLRTLTLQQKPPMAYAGWHPDKKTHLSSSSGGVLSALARHTFNTGGCVFGVIWASKDTAIFTKAENMAELAAMRGSKYTQAVPGDVYRQVKAELKKGRQILFCGTSCQVYALKRFLHKEYENLLLVDILCHGVPSRLLLQAYIREYEKQNKKEINRIQFRDKAGNWQQYHVTKHFTDGTSVSHRNGEDMFMRLFIGDFVLNKACYNCPHARLPRVGDITLGDFWGDLQKLHPEWPIPDGIGAVLGNTDKGISWLNTLQQKGNITIQPVSYDELYAGQPYTYQRHNEEPPPQRLKHLDELKHVSINVFCLHLFNQVKYGPFWINRHGLLHRFLNKMKRIKRRFTS